VRDYRDLGLFYSIEPWDELRGDVRIGQLCAQLASAFGTKGRKPRPIDFMPFFKGRQGQTPEQMDRARRQFVSQHPNLFVKVVS